uniref:Putative capsid protein n=1 Tax=viral metagenome TaxID=1070528 RepID=A0A6H1ZSV7_9ZZZZ
MKQQKGLWERPPGGEYIRVPLEYDEAEGGFYTRAEALNSDDRETINAARFQWKHAYPSIGASLN